MQVISHVRYMSATLCKRKLLCRIGVTIGVADSCCISVTLQGVKEFMSEVNILTSLHHPHVVLLIGSCPDKVRSAAPTEIVDTHTSHLHLTLR